jgi:two-component system, NarL family, nitrate/nitrite response regulator NarL
MTRILIVEEVGLVSQCLRHVLEGEEDIRVVGAASTVQEASRLLESADIALVNSNLSDNGATTLLRQARNTNATAKIIVTNVPENDEAVIRFIEQGAAGYVTLDSSVTDVLRIIRAVTADQALLSPRIAASLMARVATLTQLRGGPQADMNALESLTTREREVLTLIRRGMSNSEIADELIIELGTVKNHVHSILKKLGVSSRRSAAAMLPDSADAPLVASIRTPEPIRRPVAPPNPTYALLEAQRLASVAS